MHYITNRKEKFWREQTFPDSLKDRLELFKTRLPIREDFNDTQYLLFRDPHYIVVMHGLGLINIKNIKKQYNMLASQLKQRSRIKYKNTKNFITHKEWLTRVRHT